MNLMSSHKGASSTPPVVIVHGWGSTYDRTWAGSNLENVLEIDGRKILRADLLGHGRARAPHDSTEYAHMAKALNEQLPVDTPVDAVGFSLGGKLLLQLACENPERFRRLAVIGVGDNLFRPENGAAVAQALYEGLTEDTAEALRPVLAEAIASGNDRAALAAAIQRPASVLTPDRMSAVSAEVLLIVGDLDVIAGSADALAMSIPQVTTIALEGVDHVSSPHSPVVQTLVAQFLRQVRSPNERRSTSDHLVDPSTP